jgi:hypothetical protein
MSHIPGSEAWAIEHYGHPDRLKHGLVVVQFCGRDLRVNKGAERSFLHLERVFKLYAPRYADNIDEGRLDDWGYVKRHIKDDPNLPWSNHAFGLAIDINSLTNGYNSKGDMPREVIQRARKSGFRWGGDFSTPDPMHFEVIWTPTRIRNQFDKEGRWKD